MCTPSKEMPKICIFLWKQDIFKNKTNRDAIQNIYDELDLYEKRVSDKVQELTKKRKRKNMMEGYCSKNPEETYIMSKLAR